jgi:hypothetical protein
VGSEEGAKCGAVSGGGGVVRAAGARGGGGGGGAWSGFWRKKTAGLTDRVGLLVSEGVGHGWAGLERKGRGWAAAGLGSKGREEARPKSLLGLKSKRVKENQF